MITPRNTAPATWRCDMRVRRPVVFNSTWSMMNRMKSGSTICKAAASKAKQRADGVAMRPNQRK